MRIFEKYTGSDFEDYYDFKKNFRINAPENFNYGFDILDELANEKPVYQERKRDLLLVTSRRCPTGQQTSSRG